MIVQRTMLTFPACNMLTKLSFHLQPRLLSRLWLKKSVVRCFSHKEDGQELPVRYIPKKLRDANEGQCSSSGDNAPKNATYTRSSSRNGTTGHKTLDRRKDSRRSRMNHKQSNLSFDDAHGNHITIGHKTPDRRKDSRKSRMNHKQSNLSFDDAHVLNEDNKHGKGAVETKCSITSREVVEYMNMPQEAVQELQIFKRDGQGTSCEINPESSYDNGFTDTEYMEVPEEDVEESQETQIYNGIHDSKQERSNTCRTKQGAVQLAIELLAKRAYTCVELRKKLTAKNYPVNVVEMVVRDFQDRGLINDGLYAELFSNSKWKSSSWGPRRIKQALVKKGVDEGDVEKAVKLVFEDSEDCDQRSSIRLSSSSLQQLYVHASKQWRRSQNVVHETRKARLIRWLQYRGFDWGVISFILKKLEAECPP